jgi:hypothetical protein
MNSNEKELLNAINGTERMSGFDSYDNAEGDMGYFDDFDGDDFDNFDGDDFSYAAGGAATQAVSDPYVIQYANTTSGDITATLFGYNDYFLSTNFNNSTLAVTTLQGGTYNRLIAQTQNKPLKIGKWRFQASQNGATNNVAAQLSVTVTINQVDASGKQYSVPLNLSIMRDAYQQQSDIIDVTRPVTVDGNTYLNFTVKATTNLIISAFPIEIISAKSRLNGGASVNMARAPRLSGKNVAPVIIQTSQGVRGVTKA